MDNKNETHLLKIEDFCELRYKIYNNTEDVGRKTSCSVSDLEYILYKAGMDLQIIYISNLYVNPTHRKQKLATKLITQLTETYENSIIILEAGVSSLEYTEEPCNDDMYEILSNVTDFYTKKGFYNVNNYIGFYTFKNTMIYKNKHGKQIIDFMSKNKNNFM